MLTSDWSEGVFGRSLQCLWQRMLWVSVTGHQEISGEHILEKQETINNGKHGNKWIKDIVCPPLINAVIGTFFVVCKQWNTLWCVRNWELSSSITISVVMLQNCRVKCSTLITAHLNSLSKIWETSERRRTKGALSTKKNTIWTKYCGRLTIWSVCS